MRNIGVRTRGDRLKKEKKLIRLGGHTCLYVRQALSKFPLNYLELWPKSLSQLRFLIPTVMSYGSSAKNRFFL